MNRILTNARVVLPGEILRGTVVVENGRITAVDSGNTAIPGAQDLDGDYLLPGFVELHTDNLEKELEPRPGVFWPDPVASVLAHDAQMAGAGITTVLDAVSLGEYHDGPKRSRIMDLSVKAIRKARTMGVLKADHRLHLRCEYSDPRVLEMLAPHVDDEALLLVSLMDHTPGQRQFTDPAQYRKFFAKHSWNDEEFEAVSRRLQAIREDCAGPNRAAIVALCRERNIPLASHDDTTGEHVAMARAEQVAISEFPTTLHAATEARKAGIAIVMGAPNVVRGGSHSGNVAAAELAEAGLLDILSSDYVPGSLLSGVFVLHRALGLPLSEAVSKVSRNPARAVGLDDRGAIAPGLRGDLLRVRVVQDVPAVIETWCAGNGPAASDITRNAA
ncbi:alpha-D-ribose 1-methylphosphonate 5-triphosphate diphosphatase [Pseudodesulfovibrio cashew]|uniref:Alpha-D-ribose 1-methylphosphonate 5-triphosphate diphosphatase n=1 Tax=Pseudodesulfovibrio cashew TaxID=2678688 RepID=A0A6I6JDW4_9BACT|nr:alpha-D-ribose 1-methylphosphonate 5-triphosphate diphosphatase [Pseudodesulfovibrio cashew]QGY39208.1 alpha-D-ribose 1-methylphosphonate 5-triphosphate diphosphatase [Pseudodesulfovibrio cashew]